MKRVTILPSERQRIWGWPALVNFVLVGAGTGLYFFYSIVGIVRNGSPVYIKNVPLDLLGPAIAVLGFAAIATEAGKPLKGFQIFRNWRTSWMSREAILWGSFVAASILAWLVPNLVFRIISISAALTLMGSQGFLLYQVRAIQIWHQPIMPVFFISSGVASGFGLAWLIGGLIQSPLPVNMVAIGIIAVSANLAVWIGYSCWFSGDAFLDPPSELRRLPIQLIIVGVGHVLPIAFLFVADRDASGTNDLKSIMGIAVGLAILIGVIGQKVLIVLKSSYKNKVTID